MLWWHPIPTIKFLLLLLHSCSFAAVMTHNVNIWYATPRKGSFEPPQRGHDPKVENCCPKFYYISFWQSFLHPEVIEISSLPCFCLCFAFRLSLATALRWCDLTGSVTLGLWEDLMLSSQMRPQCETRRLKWRQILLVSPVPTPNCCSIDWFFPLKVFTV